MTCNCIPCKECGGTRIVWFSISGEYLGRRRCDDLDEYEMCEECGGTGVEEVCDECYEMEGE